MVSDVTGRYRTKRTRSFRSGSSVFELEAGSVVNVDHQSMDNLLLHFGGKDYEWYHKTILDDLIRELEPAPVEFDYGGDEIAELLDLVMADGSIHDLDQHKPEDMQTTSGSTFAWILHRCQRAEAALKRLSDASNPMIHDDRELHRARVEAQKTLDAIVQRDGSAA